MSKATKPIEFSRRHLPGETAASVMRFMGSLVDLDITFDEAVRPRDPGRFRENLVSEEKLWTSTPPPPPPLPGPSTRKRKTKCNITLINKKIKTVKNLRSFNSQTHSTPVM